MKRRDFILFGAGGLAALPLRAHAQASGKVWRMGFLAHGYESFYDALFEGLRPLGYVEGKNLIVERRYAEGHPERFPDFAAEMVRLKVDIIVVSTTPAALAVKNTTSAIPVVFPNAISPVESGVVASLAMNLAEMYRRGAYFVDKILKGTKPAELPVEQVTKFELVLNLRTAKAMGWAIPPTIVATADEVME